MVVGPGFLPDFAAFVRDDWNRLVGLWPPPKEPESIARLYGLDGGSAAFLSLVSILFDNVDGMYWTCYARDAEILEVLRRDLRGREGIKLVETTFNQDA